jgi:hypothetical protein
MTSPDNFVSRWARLKRGADLASKTNSAANGSLPGAVAATAVESADQPDEVIDEPFDPASLPSIETITVDTDIRGFLQSRVPAALTRAALRRAWASDPAIRDFIGIAENQWDFNDPTGMPGFGPMREADNLPALLTRALGERDEFAEKIREIPASAPPAVVDREPSKPDPSLQRISERSLSVDETSNLPDHSNETTATRNDAVAEEDDSSQSRRSHGSALPR